MNAIAFHCQVPPAYCKNSDTFFTDRDNTNLNRWGREETETQIQNAHTTTSTAPGNGSTGRLEVYIQTVITANQCRLPLNIYSLAHFSVFLYSEMASLTWAVCSLGIKRSRQQAPCTYHADKNRAEAAEKKYASQTEEKIYS